ncbi:MAG: DUF5131 family protein [Clostridia bacterium]|nr:DUF5131 family protein [Clostridia bacterium]
MPDVTWNPWHGCHKISAGCEHCYVYRGDLAYGRDPTVPTLTGNFRLPVAHNRQGEYKILSGSTVYTCFTSDFFLEEADDWRIEAWEMIRARPDLHFFFITKRIDRMQVNLPLDWGEGYPHVTIGCTVENQEMADYRLPIFLSLPIRHRHIICEPLLERIDLSRYLDSNAFEQLLAGGESGSEARPCRMEWVLDLRRQAIEANLSFYFKQTGARFIKDGRLYRVPRKLQHVQAKKSGLSIGPRKL